MVQMIKVEVYFNLHRKCLSVRSRVTGPTYGKVIGHLPAIVLEGATFHVSEPGRQRVLRERRKNVHAVVRGKVCLEWLRAVWDEGLKCDPWIGVTKKDRVVPVTYNPYKFETFVEADGGHKPVQSAELVEIRGRRITALNPK